MKTREEISEKLTTLAKRDALILAVLAIFVWYLAVENQWYESIHEFLESHEDWELDEILISIWAAGVACFIYAWRRVIELNQQIRLRDRAEEKTSWIATHDTLTSLPNRHYLNALSRAGERTKQPFKAILAIDLDGFKKVNDLLGHDGGDELLVVTASRLRQHFPTGTFIRMGGDEFIVLLEFASENPQELGRSVIRNLSTPVEIRGVKVEIGACIGIAVLDGDIDLKTGIGHADAAMYAAKRSGRNMVCIFKPKMEHMLQRRAQMELALRSAIKNDKIVPHYQPLVDLSSGKVNGFEALARWRGESGEDYEPDMFIALAEDTGLITELSERILRRACRDACNWPKDVTLAFNISPTQLTDGLLGLRIVKILADTGLPPNRLEVEITETALAREKQSATRIILDLHAAGIRVALDDFGTGYSSLAQLSQFEFDKIKIDRSFISSFQSDQKQMKIVKSIIGLGKGLNIQVTAEGIEDETQLSTLKSIGCDHGQGYFFARALPGEDVDRFLSGFGEESFKQKRIA